MWKIVLAFIAFAALALFMLTRSGANIDMGGEKHDVTGGHAEAASAPASQAASEVPALAASAAASQ
jgi:hypothetical protein